MGNIFSVDGALYKTLSLLADIFYVSLLWFVFSLPIVTIGAATTAAYTVCTKRVTRSDAAIFRDFWQSFRQKWWLATRLFLAAAALAGLAYANLLSINQFDGNLRMFLFAAQIVLIVELAFVSVYLFALLSRLEMGFVQLFKTAFVMANRHMLTTLGVAAIGLSLLFLTAQYLVLTILLPGIFLLSTAYLLMRVFRKYWPELMPAEIPAESSEERP